jgi:L-cysteate sulfo-lyase
MAVDPPARTPSRALLPRFRHPEMSIPGVRGVHESALNRLPRVRLAHLPTPLEEAPRLSAYLDGPRLFVKRDDCTGLALGGNKVRKLEFELAAAVESDADCVVSGGVVQSNAARQVAAACAKLGLECHLALMHGRIPALEPGYDATGNVLLDRLLGAIVHEIPWTEDRDASLQTVAKTLRAGGRRPYVVPYGVSSALGAMGYASMVLELLQQCAVMGIVPTHVVHASGSAGTQAGILAMVAALGHGMGCIGIDVDAQPQRVAADVKKIGRAAAALLGAHDRWSDDRVEIAAGYAGPTYGVPDSSTLEAIGVAARLEALVLDPVYSGKGLAGLIGLVRAGRFSKDDVVVWVHTGGAPGVFAYPSVMAKAASQGADLR